MRSLLALALYNQTLAPKADGHHSEAVSHGPGGA
jgi:hypothetical protein